MNDKLIEKITLLIHNFIENNKEDDLELLLPSIVNSIVQEMNLQEYVNGVIITDYYPENHSSKGCIDENNNLCIFKKGIEEDLISVLEQAPYLSEFEQSICKIMLYIKTIIHETQHLKQSKLLEEDTQNESFETLITRVSKQENSGIGYALFYDVFPVERLADINAYRGVVRIIEKFGGDIERLLTLFKSYSLHEEFYYYYKYGFNGPTMNYLDFFGNKDEMDDFKQKILNKDISIEDRLLYGFEITEEEYKALVMQYLELTEQLKSFSNSRK